MNKKVLSTATLLSLLSPAFLYAQTCPFDESAARPSWVNKLGGSDSDIYGVGIAQYDSKTHSSIFDLRTVSEQQAKKAMTTQLESNIVNKLLLNKTFQNTKLITQAKKITSQVSEYTLPEVNVSERWLDTQNCILWTQVTVGKDVVSEYIDEVANLEQNVNEALDQNLTLSIKEELNKKQFYLNYSGFSKAIQSTASLTIGDEEKTALAWMIQEGFDPYSPSFGQGMVWTSNFQMYSNVSPFVSFITMGAPTKEQLSYILKSYKQLGIDINSLKSRTHQMQLQALDSADYSDSGAFLGLGTPNQRNDGSLAYRLAISLNKQQSSDRLKIDKKYDSQSLYNFGGWNLLHLATFAKRDDLVKLLLDDGISPNSLDSSGMTAAQYAIASEDKKLSEAYLSYKGSLNGIYLTATKTLLYRVVTNTVTPAVVQNISTDNVLTNLIGKIKSKDKEDIQAVSAQLSQDIQLMGQYYKISGQLPISDEQKNINIKVLKSIL